MNAADRKLIKRMTFLRNLLKKFKARLYGVDPGVSFLVQNGVRLKLRKTPFEKPKAEKVWKVFHTDGPDWAWLEPLLVELRTFRRKEKAKKA